MAQKASKIISLIFHPLLIPSYTFIIFFFTPLLIFNANGSIKIILLLMVFISTFALPLIISALLLHRKAIKSIYMENKEDRVLPLAATAISFYACYHLLVRMQLSPVFYLFLLGSTLIIILALITNLFWKPSLHMLAIGGLIGTLLSLSARYQVGYRILISFAFLSAGLIAFARLKNEAHNQAQIYVSFIAGLGIMFGFFYLI